MKNKSSKKYLEDIGFFFEIIFFFVSGYSFAGGKISFAFLSFVIGLVLALIVGDLIYKRGKGERENEG